MSWMNQQYVFSVYEWLQLTVLRVIGLKPLNSLVDDIVEMMSEWK
jgi:hypothetical protein